MTDEERFEVMKKAGWFKVKQQEGPVKNQEPWEARLDAIEAKLDSLLELLRSNGEAVTVEEAQALKLKPGSLSARWHTLEAASDIDPLTELVIVQRRPEMTVEQAVKTLTNLPPIHDPNGGRR
jgi:hypothetical protein